jgi:autotransporter-associated beta strand protein
MITRRNPFTTIRILTRSIAALVAATALVNPSATHAATGDWNIDANTSGWGAAGNWLGGVIPDAMDDTANFLFDITAARTVTLDGSRTLGAMSVGDPLTAFFGYTFSANGQGGALIFDTSAGDANLTFSAAQAGAANVFNVPLQLNDTLNVHALNTGTHVFNGNISGAGGLVFDASGTHPSGTGSIVGQANLIGFNTFAGGLTTTEVRVQAASRFALGSGTVTVNDSGAVLLNGAGFYSNNFVLNGLGWNEGAQGRLGALRIDTNSTVNGTITIGSAEARIAGNGGAGVTTVLNGVIGESFAGANLDFGRWVPTGQAAMLSTFVINNTAAVTGVLSISSGTLRVGNGGTTGDINSFSSIVFGKTNSGAEPAGAATLAFNRSDNYTLTRSISETVNGGGFRVVGSLLHSGTGTLTLDNATNSYTGTTTANGLNGKLILGTGGAYNVGIAGVTPGGIAMPSPAWIRIRDCKPS